MYMKTMLTAILLFFLLAAGATTKTVLGSSGQGWSDPSNFSPSGIPQNNDVVIIPVGITISVKGSIYNTQPFLKIYIYGTLDFDPSGQLDLSASSLIQIFAGGRITTNGSSSEQITMGGVVKYNGHNDGTVTGPAYASAGTSSSRTSVTDGGFVYGVLPIRLRSFRLSGNQTTVRLDWSLFQEGEGERYTVERCIQGSWQELFQVRPPGFTSAEQAFSYTDLSPAQGIDLYRLKLESPGGQTLYSPVLKAVLGSQESGLLVYPNPVRQTAVLTWKQPLTSGHLSIHDLSGGTVWEKTLGPACTALSMDLSSLRPGFYYLVLEEGRQPVEKTGFVKTP